MSIPAKFEISNSKRSVQLNGGKDKQGVVGCKNMNFKKQKNEFPENIYSNSPAKLVVSK